MATAEELLSTTNSDVDKTFVIDNDLRTIIIPTGIKNLGAESDDKVMRVWFRMPSSYCGIDLSTFNIRINYLNANADGDIYDVDDKVLQADGTITFSWLIGRHAAAYKGDVKFNVCLKDADQTGAVLREFNTTIASLPILQGLETTEQTLSEYNDLLEQWRAKLFGIGDTEEAKIIALSEEQQAAIKSEGEVQMSAVEAKGAEILGTIPTDYTTTYNNANKALRTRATAIVETMEGEVIVAEDCSDDYLRGMRIFGKSTQVSTTGKNQVDLSGFEFSDSNYTHMLTYGSVSADALWRFLKANTGKSVVLSMTTTGVQSGIVIGSLRFYSEDNTLLCALVPNVEHIIRELPEAFKVAYIYGSTTGASVKNVQIEFGTEATEYEPYTGGTPSPNPQYPQGVVSVENPTMTVCGKNLCTIDHIELTGSSLTTKIFEGNLKLPATLTYTQDFARTTGSAMFGFLIDDVWYYSAAGETSGTYIKLLDYGDKLSAVTVLNWAVETGNLTGMQLEVGSEATDYEKYKESQNIQLTRTLPGIPVTSGGNYTDERGQEWICDEIDFERGVHIQRINHVELTGTEHMVLSASKWQKEGMVSAYAAYLIPPEQYGVDTPEAMPICFSTHATPNGWEWSWYNNLDNVGVRKNIFHMSFNNLATGVVDTDTDESKLTKFKAYIANQYAVGTPVTISYPIATPIETALTDEELFNFSQLHSNYLSTTVLNDSGAHMEVSYNADTKTYLDRLPKATDEQVQAAVDAWLTAHFTVAEEASF